MNKYVLSFLFLLVTVAAMGQKKSKVNLIKSTVMEANKGANGKNIIKVRDGVFKQDYSTLTSDSALFYPDLNMVDAFGHVIINQGDTLNIYSDKLNYNGNTKVAILTDNVKMVDKDATLTTNYLTYNTATRIATYTGGGKLVNKENTLVSKNGYYFAKSRDSYFRYNVVCTTADAIIKTDTLRYNSGTRISYFYGPTNIYGTKDKDVLYTENGYYATIPEQAYFGKNNLYTQGSKSLKGDSLFYDRLKGYGRAVKHVTFYDSEQKATIKGDLGEYYKAEEKTVMTQNPYMVFVTEDSTKTDSAKARGILPKADSIAKKLPAAINSNKKVTLQTAADSINKKLPGAVKVNNANRKMTLQGITDSVTKKLPARVNTSTANKKMTLQGITDSVIKRAPQLNSKSLPSPTKKQSADLKQITDKAAGIKNIKEIKGVAQQPKNTKYDSIYLVADTLETQILTYKDLKTLQQNRFLASHRDTSIKIVPHIVYKTSPKFLTLDAPKMPVDTSYIHRNFFGKPLPPAPKVVSKPKVITKKMATDTLKIRLKNDSLKRIQLKADSVALNLRKDLTDTSRIRIIVGHHHAKLFKFDLQAKADSMFYANSDSTIRCFVNPMIWTQGSQLSGDTINLQMKNRKLDNMDMFPAAFVVNIEKADSIHFNQLGGKKMHGIFKNNKLSNMLITGNAETIYFKRDSVKNIVTDMQRSISSSINVNFKNGQLGRVAFLTKVENRIIPIGKVKEDEKILKNFIWKPKERPISKESILSAYKKPLAPKTDKTVGTNGTAGKGVPIKGAATKKPVPDKPVLNKPSDNPAARDTTIKQPAIKSAKDSTAKKDSTVKKDTSAVQKAGLKKP